MTNREKEIFEYIEKDPVYLPLVHHVARLEEELDALDRLPKIKSDPGNPSRQKKLPAAAMYKEFFQQYINGLKVLQRRAGVDDVEEESPLRKWMNAHVDA